MNFGREAKLCQLSADMLTHTTSSDPVWNQKYKNDVKMILLRTMFMESDGLIRRNPHWTPGIGGYGLWQVELGSVIDSVKEWHFDNQHAAEVQLYLLECKKVVKTSALGAEIYTLKPREVLDKLTCPEWDALACALARQHYRRAPGLIPSTCEDQFDYWVRKYNCGNEQKKTGVFASHTYAEALKLWRSHECLVNSALLALQQWT